MSNQTSSTVTTSLNSPPPAPPASPATTFGSIGDSLSNIGSNIDNFSTGYFYSYQVFE